MIALFLYVKTALCVNMLWSLYLKMFELLNICSLYLHTFFKLLFSFSEDVSKGKYGTLPLIRSDTKSIKREFTRVKDLNKAGSGKSVWLRARLHTVRARGKQCFIVLRQQQYSVQVIISVSETVSKAMVKFSST